MKYLLAILLTLAATAALADGTVPLDETYAFDFNTVRPSTGAPFTIGGTPEIEVYEEGSTTQITAGDTLTLDLDGVTGFHHVDLVCTAANGYEVGKWYTAVIAGTTPTVDSISVAGRQVARFRVVAAEDSAGYPVATIKDGTGTGEIDTASGLVSANVTQWLGSAAATPTVAGVPEVDVTHANGSAITTSGAVDANVTQVGGDTTAANNLEEAFNGDATGAPAAFSTFSVTGGATIANSGGTGLTITGGNGATGMSVTGNGTGHGALFTSGSGATGNGIQATSAATDGTGFSALGSGIGHGIAGTGGSSDGNGALFTGVAAGAGLRANGGVTGAGGQFVGGSTSGTGWVATGRGTGNGATITSGNGATGAGLSIAAASTNGSGFIATGTGTGSGGVFTSGSGATGNGITATAASTDGNGLSLTGTGTGAGFSIAGVTNGILATASAGTAINAASLGSNGHGMVLTGNGTGRGARFAGGSSGAGLDLDGGGTTEDLNLQTGAPDLAAVMFTNDSGSSYAAAHANSVVKQIADNAGGGFTDDEATAIKTILGVPASGTTPETPSSGVLFDIHDSLGNAGTLDDLYTGSQLETDITAIDDIIDTEVPNINSIVGSITYGNSALKTLIDAKASQASLDSVATDASGANTKSANIQTRLPTTLVDGKMDSTASITLEPEDIQTIAEDISEELGEVSLTDADQEPVPGSRTVALVHTANEGLKYNKTISLRPIGEPATIAVDFAADMPANGRIATVDSVAISSGTAGGLTFGTSGRDYTKAKLRITPVTSGTYLVTVQVTYTTNTSNQGVIRIVVP